MKYRLKIWLNIALSIIISLTVMTLPSYALTDMQWDMFDANGIYYWNPTGSDCFTSSLGSYSGVETAGASPEQAAFIDVYHDLAAQLSIEFGIPWELAIAQGIKESSAGSSRFARERYNFHGIHAFTSNPDAAWAYSSPENGWIGYFHNLATTRTYANNGLFVGDTITNPFSAISVIGQSYATDGSYTESVINSYLPIVIKRANDMGWPTTEELASENPIIYENAARIAGGGEAPYNRSGSGSLADPFSFSPNGISGNSEGLTGITSTAAGVCSTGQGNGNINQTALTLAWPVKGEHAKDDPKPEYLAALEFIGVTNSSDIYVSYGASCDIFVTSVMRYSGVDPDFPLYLGSQKTYLPKHPETYQYIGQAESTDLVQPGDIRISSSHIELVVKREDGTLAIASASHGDRTAEVGNYYNDSSFSIYRHM